MSVLDSAIPLASTHEAEKLNARFSLDPRSLIDRNSLPFLRCCSSGTFHANKEAYRPASKVLASDTVIPVCWPPGLWQSRNCQKHDTSLCRQSSRSRAGRDGRLPVLLRPARAAYVPTSRPYGNTNRAQTPETSAHKQVFIYEHDPQNRSFSREFQRPGNCWVVNISDESRHPE